MSNYTKEQIENGTLSAKDILLSWTSGQGATGKEPAKYNHVKDGAINNIPVNVSLMTAIAEMFVVKSRPSDKFYDALRAGYLSINHLDEYKTALVKKEPLVGHYLTSRDYLESCFALLPELEKPSFEAILDSLKDYKASMAKTELQSIIENVIDLCTIKAYTTNDLTEEQRAKYNDLVEKETAIAGATNALSLYLEDIKPIAETTIQGRFYPERGQGAELVKLLEQEGYSILVNTPVPAKLDSNFNTVEAAYVLMSIKVI